MLLRLPTRAELRALVVHGGKAYIQHCATIQVDRWHVNIKVLRFQPSGPSMLKYIEAFELPPHDLKQLVFTYPRCSSDLASPSATEPLSRRFGEFRPLF